MGLYFCNNAIFSKDSHINEDANFGKDAHGRIFLEGCSWTVILVRTVMDSHFW